MMKRLVCFVFCIVLLLTGTISIAEEPKSDTGIWELMAYSDEFGFPTNKKYIVNKGVCIGTFSNSATTNSQLHAVVFCQENRGYHQIKIRFAEYGKYIVKNPTSKNVWFNFVMMDSSGEKQYFNGLTDAFIPKQNQDMWLGTDATHAVIKALKAGGTIRFAFTEQDNPHNKYIFTIEDASGFDVAYDKWIIQYGYLN